MNKWYPLRYISTLIWIGFLLAISFMEAPLKFQASSVTLSIGLEIGQLVFGVLNKIEWVLFLMIILSFLLAPTKIKSIIPTVILAVIMLAQTFYLLPVLDDRASLIISGAEPSASNVHFYYVALEIIKLITLTVTTIDFIYFTSNETK